MKDSDRNKICSFSCAEEKPLRGCTPCSKHENNIKETSSEEITTLVWEDQTDENDEETTTENDEETTTDSSVATNEMETTTPIPTTMPTTIATTTKTPTTIPTTPNWKELCQSLCRIGEGGSLCNCDLLPFDG